jgi:hypothetical protein
VPLQYADRGKETTTTIGTGDITLAGAVAQFTTIASEVDLNTWFGYAIVGQPGTEWETGLGYLSGSTTLVRSQPKDGSSGTETLVNFSSGTKNVFLTIPAFAKDSDTGIAMALINNMAWR